MTKTPDQGPQDARLAELYDRMASRDQAMWERLAERDSKLQDRMIDLCSRMLENSSVDRVVHDGFDKVSNQLKEQLSPLRDLTPSMVNGFTGVSNRLEDQLRPLRDLAAYHAPLDDDQKILLKSLRLALARPNYSLSPGDVPGRLLTTDSGNKAGSFAS
jgi:hypothetical protein